MFSMSLSLSCFPFTLTYPWRPFGLFPCSLLSFLVIVCTVVWSVSCLAVVVLPPSSVAVFVCVLSCARLLAAFAGGWAPLVPRVRCVCVIVIMSCRGGSSVCFRCWPSLSLPLLWSVPLSVSLGCLSLSVCRAPLLHHVSSSSGSNSNIKCKLKLQLMMRYCLSVCDVSL